MGENVNASHKQSIDYKIVAKLLFDGIINYKGGIIALNVNGYIEPQQEVNSFLTDLKHVLTFEDCHLDILYRKRDEDPLDPHTTENTLLDLEYDTEDVKNELLSLTEKEYIETIVDDKDRNRPPFRVFGKLVKEKEVYIKVKIRDKTKHKVFCVSFHYPRRPLKSGPYK